MKKIIAMLLVGAALTSSASAEAIWFKEVSNRFDYVKYATWIMTQLKVDFGVWPVAPGHTAGAVFTDDGWASVYWQEAEWEYNAPSPFGSWDEHWTVYLNARGENGQYMGQSLVPFNVEFALYVTDAEGNWYWDNNNGWNHHYFVD